MKTFFLCWLIASVVAGFINYALMQFTDYDDDN
jgi:hypothetical protein